jgi:hypothetical protein
MATTIPYAYLRRKTLDAARRAQDGERPRSGRANDWRGADRDIEMAGAMPAWRLARPSYSLSRAVRKASGNRSARRRGAETAAMSFWCLLASGQITNAKIEGWRNLAERPFDQIIDLGA